MTQLITTGRIQDKELWAEQGWTTIDVTVKSVSKAKSLAPTWEMVMGYKKGTLNERDYTQQYMAILDKCRRAEKSRWESTLENHKNLVFLCYCRAGAFCHRHLVAKAFVDFAIDEMDIEDIDLVAERTPHPPTPPRKIVHKHNGEYVVTTIEEPTVRHYAGIGATLTPPKVLKEMESIAALLEEKGFVLRSGGAKGADSAFEKGVKNSSMKEIFYASDCEDWCLKEVSRYVPSNRPPLEKMKSYTQKLLGRNMKQILGARGDKPVDFVVCWTSDGKDSGGTGYGLRCAKEHGIAVYNLFNKEDRKEFYEFVKKA
jgi:uncharacterized protein YeaO (DUF488 family)